MVDGLGHGSARSQKLVPGFFLSFSISNGPEVDHFRPALLCFFWEDCGQDMVSICVCAFADVLYETCSTCYGRSEMRMMVCGLQNYSMGGQMDRLGGYGGMDWTSSLRTYTGGVDGHGMGASARSLASGLLLLSMVLACIVLHLRRAARFAFSFFLSLSCNLLLPLLLYHLLWSQLCVRWVVYSLWFRRSSMVECGHGCWFYFPLFL